MKNGTFRTQSYVYKVIIFKCLAVNVIDVSKYFFARSCLVKIISKEKSIDVKRGFLNTVSCQSYLVLYCYHCADTTTTTLNCRIYGTKPLFQPKLQTTIGNLTSWVVINSHTVIQFVVNALSHVTTSFGVFVGSWLLWRYLNLYFPTLQKHSKGRHQYILDIVWGAKVLF